MKAIVNTTYGSADVLSIKQIPKPTPKAKELLVKVCATTVNRTDTGLRSVEYFISRLYTGLFKPRFQVLGSEFSGVVVGVGSDVTRFRVGDEVFGLSTWNFGAHAEYLAVAESGSVALKPKNMTFEEATAICEGPYLALNYLNKVGLQSQHRILINGVSGSIGSSGLQLAKYFGAEVTAVTDTKHLGLAKALGADYVIDYTKQDFTQSGQEFDFVFDAVGKSTFFKCRPLLKPTGVYFSTELGPYWQNVYLPLFTKRIIFPIPKDSQEQVELFRTLAEAGRLRAVIDHVCDFEQIPDAHRYVEKGMKTGSVVVRVA